MTGELVLSLGFWLAMGTKRHMAINRITMRALHLSLLTLSAVSWIPRDAAAQIAGEKYSDRPSISSVKAQAHSDLDSNWQNLKRAKLEATAMFLELYSDREIYFLARDAEYLYDFAHLMDPANSRIHLLNISRGNMGASGITKYLAENGIDEASLKDGKKVLFVDTGFSGTIPRSIGSRFSPAANQNLKTHLLVSANPLHPSTRSFLYHLNPAVNEKDPSALHGTIVEYEHMPHYTFRADAFGQESSTSPSIAISQDLEPDGKVSRAIALKYMEDLRAFAEDPGTKTLFQQRRQLWQSFRSKFSNREELKKSLNEFLNNTKLEIPRALREAMVRDLIEAVSVMKLMPEPLKLHDVGLQGNESETWSSWEEDLDEDQIPLAGKKEAAKTKVHKSEPKITKAELIEKHPEWEDLLSDPVTQIPKAMQNQDWGRLLVIADLYSDAEFRSVFAKALAQAPIDAKTDAVVEALLQKSEWRESILNGYFKEYERRPQRTGIFLDSAFEKYVFPNLANYNLGLTGKVLGAHDFSAPERKEAISRAVIILGFLPSSTKSIEIIREGARVAAAEFKEPEEFSRFMATLLVAIPDGETFARLVIDEISKSLVSDPSSAKRLMAWLAHTYDLTNEDKGAALGWKPLDENLPISIDLVEPLIDRIADNLKYLPTTNTAALKSFYAVQLGSFRDKLHFAHSELSYSDDDAYNDFLEAAGGKSDDVEILIEEDSDKFIEEKLGDPTMTPEERLKKRLKDSVSQDDWQKANDPYASVVPKKNWDTPYTPQMQTASQDHFGYEMITTDLAEPGKHGKISLVRRNTDGKLFVWKQAVDTDPAHFESFEKEIERAKVWRKLGLSQVIAFWHPDGKSLLKTYRPGKTLADYLKDPEFWKDGNRVQKKFIEFIQRAASTKHYVGDLNPRNLVFVENGTESDWEIIDSGSIRSRKSVGGTTVEYATKFYEKLSPKIASEYRPILLKILEDCACTDILEALGGNFKNPRVGVVAP